MRKRKLLTSSERSVYTYGYLHSAADWALEQAKGTEEGRFYNCMSLIILSAFCIEAYLNHIGSILLPYWDDEVKKDLSIHNKLKIICHNLNLVPDFSKRPFQSFKHIVKFRNLMAHATSEKILNRGIQVVGDGEQLKYPETWWEQHSTLKIAKRWLDDVESIISKITAATGKDDIPPLGMLSLGTHIGTIK
jgi:hypothetical protein